MKLDTIMESSQFEAAKLAVSDPNYFTSNPEFAQRRFALAGSCSFFPVIDYSPAVRLYHKVLMQKPGMTLGALDVVRDVTCSDGWLFVQSEPYMSLLWDFLRSQFKSPGSFIVNILQRERQLRLGIEKRLNIIDGCSAKEEEILELFHGTSSYGSLLLDRFADFKYVEHLIDKSRTHLGPHDKKKLFLDFMYPDEEVSCFYVIDNLLLKLAIDTVKKGFTNGKAIHYGQIAGYLERTDVVPCRLESPVHLRECVESILYKNNFSNELEKQRRDFFSDRRIALAAKNGAYRDILNCVKGTSAQRQYQRAHIEFARLALNYNERNKKYRTKFFRLLQKWLEANDCDPMSTLLPDAFSILPNKEVTCDLFSGETK